MLRILTLAALWTLAWMPVSQAAIASKSENSTDWPQLRGPEHNGISRESGWQTHWPKEGPKALWKAEVGTGATAVAVFKGKLYAFGNKANQDLIGCYNAETGVKIWEKSYPCPNDPNLYEGGPNATPTVDGNFVYTLSKKGNIFCWDATTGNEIWKCDASKIAGAKPPTWGFSGAPLVEGNLLLLNVCSAGLALDKTTGSIKWKSGVEPGGYASPVAFTLNGQRTIALFAAKELIGLNPQDGKVVWTFPWKTDYDVNASDPIISGDKIFISSGYTSSGAVIHLGPGGPVEVWKNKELRAQTSNSVLWEGHLFGFDGNSNTKKAFLRCLEFQTGVKKWEQPLKGSLMLADGKLIILTPDGKLIVVEASSTGYTELGNAQVLNGHCWTAPVLSNGRVYCRDAVGMLVCLDVRK